MIQDRPELSSPAPSRPGAKQRSRRAWAPAAALLGLAFLLLTTPPASAALDSGLQDAIVASNTQGLLVQRMTKAAALIAMGIRTEEARAELQDSRLAFQAALAQLHVPSPDAASRASTHAVGPNEIAALTTLWHAFNDEVQQLEHAHSISPTQITPILARAAALTAAIERSEQRYVKAATVSSLARVLAKLTHVAAQQSILAERMAKDFVILAYQQRAASDTERLTENRDRFERVLEGLLLGAPELGLLPAPTESVRRELQAIKAAWDELKPLLTTEGLAAPSRARVAEVTRRHSLLLEELAQLAQLYAAL